MNYFASGLVSDPCVKRADKEAAFLSSALLKQIWSALTCQRFGRRD
jgi:hypothetical protein